MELFKQLKNLKWILLILIILIFVVLYKEKSNAGKTPDYSTNSNQKSEQLQTKLDDFITYKIPDGWTKEIQVNEDLKLEIITLKSPDYRQEGYDMTGMTISILQNPVQKPQNWFSSIGSTNDPTVTDLKRTTIDGKEALSYYYDYEGHGYNLDVDQDGKLWEIDISSDSLEEENRFRNEIDEFINSIRFK